MLAKQVVIVLSLSDEFGVVEFGVENQTVFLNLHLIFSEIVLLSIFSVITWIVKSTCTINLKRCKRFKAIKIRIKYCPLYLRCFPFGKCNRNVFPLFLDNSTLSVNQSSNCSSNQFKWSQLRMSEHCRILGLVLK